jgi:hypothetical protein
MATNWYVRPEGDDAKTGKSWANAKRYLLSLLEDEFVKPGDTIWVASDQVDQWYPGWGDEAEFSPIWDSDQSDAPSWQGNEDDFVRIISCDDTGDPEPPTAWQAGARIAGLSGFGWVISGPVYMWGLTVESADHLWFQPFHRRSTAGLTEAQMPFASVVAENCTFRITSSSYTITYMRFTNWSLYPPGGRAADQFDYFFKDCTFSLQDSQSHISAYGYANMRFEGCTLLCASNLASDPFIVRFGANLEFYGCDLSGCPSSKYIIGYAPMAEAAAWDVYRGEVGACHVLIERCKLPASFMGCFRPTSTELPYSGDDHLRGEMYFSANSGNIDTRIFEWGSLRGNAFGNSIVYRTGGANNGTGSYSIKVVTPGSGKAAPGPYFPFCLKPIRFYCFETGTKTFTFELVYDYGNVDLTDRDVWVELLHMGAAVPGTVTRSLPHQLSGATLLPAGVGTGNWTTTGLTQPRSQKVSVTATIDHEQILEFQIKVGKPGRTIYIDPLVVVT